MEVTYKNIDDYIASFDTETQEILQQIRQVVHEAAPEAVEDIRYAMPTFRYKDKNLVHFAAFKDHYSFFPTPSGVDMASKTEIAKYVTGKGTISFPKTIPVPLDLIKNITTFRKNEIDGN